MQLVGYEPSGVGPALLTAEAGSIERRVLDSGTELSLPLGARRCAGVVDGNRHRSCEQPATPYCPEHTSTWICARCTGTCLKPEMDCDEEHAVYLAAFAPDTFKVGVTKSWRLETRLLEQGADRAAHVRTVSDGRIARQLEAEIAETVTDRVRTPTKIDALAETVDEDAWERLLAEYDPLDRFDLSYGVSPTSRPVRETVATGEVLGVKGRLLLIDRSETTYVVDMRDLVGHEIDPDGTGTQLQSSLGSFSE